MIICKYVLVLTEHLHVSSISTSVRTLSNVTSCLYNRSIRNKKKKTKQNEKGLIKSALCKPRDKR